MPQKPISPYGNSKLIVEKILNDYGNAYGLKYVVLRYFNAAGADPEGEIGENHEPETHLIPLVLEAATEKRTEINVFGIDYPTTDGTCIRDYVHVSDIADAHLLAIKYLENGGKSDNFNLGNEHGISVLEIINVAKEVTGKDIPVKMMSRREGDTAELVSSNKKAKEMLFWKPKYIEINQIIEHAWNWMTMR
jgi:UDP-glucose 4-epimerase